MVDKPGRHHLNQVTKVSILSSKSCCYHVTPKMMQGGGHITSVVFLSKTYNPSPVMRKHQIDPHWGIFYKIMHQCSSKILWSWKARKDWKTATDQRWVRRHDNYMQCRILDQTVEQKKDISGKTGEIQTKSGVW